MDHAKDSEASPDPVHVFMFVVPQIPRSPLLPNNTSRVDRVSSTDAARNLPSPLQSGFIAVPSHIQGTINMFGGSNSQPSYGSTVIQINNHTGNSMAPEGESTTIKTLLYPSSSLSADNSSCQMPTQLSSSITSDQNSSSLQKDTVPTSSQLGDFQTARGRRHSDSALANNITDETARRFMSNLPIRERRQGLSSRLSGIQRHRRSRTYLTFMTIPLPYVYSFVLPHIREFFHRSHSNVFAQIGSSNAV